MLSERLVVPVPFLTDTRVGANTKIESLFDYRRHGVNVAARCACGHVGILDSGRLLRFFMVRRWDTRKHLIPSRLRCSACGRKAYQVRLTHQMPSGPGWGPQTERQWKALVKRMRG